MNQDIVLESLASGIFRIRLERPERMNALGAATVVALRHAVQEACDRKARVLMIRGSGRAFCAGADLKERKGMDLPARIAHNAGINAANDAIAAAPCVTIAVMNGLALGGGLEMALACDMRFAAAGVSLGLTESRVGAFPGAGGTQRLPRVVGVARALQMMFTAEPVSADHALSMGLVNAVFPTESLDQQVMAMAQLLVTRSPTSLATIKRLVYQGIEMPLADALRNDRAALPAILDSVDYAEGLAAFEEKRAPQFSDRVA